MYSMRIEDLMKSDRQEEYNFDLVQIFVCVSFKV